MITAEQRQDIREAFKRDSRMSVMKLSRTLGISVNTVRKYARAYGVYEVNQHNEWTEEEDEIVRSVVDDPRIYVAAKSIMNMLHRHTLDSILTHMRLMSRREHPERHRKNSKKQGN